MASTINADTTNGVVVTSDTSGEIELQANGVTKAKVTANGLQDANGASLRGGSFRNLTINGDMSLAQRGTSTTGLQYNNDNNYPCCDRWKFQEFGSTSYTAAFTGSQDTDVPSGQGFIKSLKLACTTADTTVESDTQLIWAQNFEGQMLQHLKFGTSSAESLTLSFWVKSNLTGIFAVNLYNADNVRHATYTYSISTADTWEKITLTFSGDTVDGFNNDNAFSLAIRFVLAAGSNHTSGTSTNGDFIEYDATRIAPSMTNNLGSSTSNYINITGVQLEVGEGASDFEFLPYDVQLQRCQRYYYSHVDGNTQTIGLGNVHDTTTAYIPIFFPVTMRAAPALVYNNTTNYYYFAVVGSGKYVNSLTAYAPSTNQMTISGTINSALSVGTARLLRTINANAYIHLDAEL